MFPGQHDNEHIVFFFQKHWLELMYPVGRFCVEQFLIFMVILFMYFRGQEVVHTMEGHVMIVVIIVALFFTMITFWIRVFNYFLRVVIVTDYRIIDVNQKIFVTLDEDIIDMRLIQDIRAETHGFFPNLVKCGNITFVLSASSQPKMLHNVTHPQRICGKITEVREIYKKLNGETSHQSQSSDYAGVK